MPRTVSDKSVESAGDAPAAPSLVNAALRRFPWPANPGQRYCLASPWLAVVNARGPWGVWQHYRKEPAWLPLYDSLWRKAWFLAASAEVKVFMLTFWRQAAKEDYWGIVWGEPARLCFTWGVDPETLNAGLTAMLAGGALVYLTHAEKAATEAWRPGGRRAANGEGVGGKRGTIGGDSGGGNGAQVQTETETGTARGTGTGDRRQPTGKRARALVSGSVGVLSNTDTAAGAGTETGRQRQGHPQGQAQGTGHSRQPRKPDNLTESDQGSGKTRAGTRSRRSPSVDRSEPRRLGDLVHWQDPLAVDFGRRMFRIITRREPPPDPFAATDEDKSILGAWSSQWVDVFSKALKPEQLGAFLDRVERDVNRKRGKPNVKNLGGLAMEVIVPGIIARMQGGK